MAISGSTTSNTFSDISGAVQDLFSGLSADTAASLKAQGLEIQAGATRISAEGIVQQAQGLRIKAASEAGDPPSHPVLFEDVDISKQIGALVKPFPMSATMRKFAMQRPLLCGGAGGNMKHIYS